MFNFKTDLDELIFLGLGPATTGVPPSFTQALATAGAISDAEFTVLLNNFVFSNSTTLGSVTFGGTPSDSIKGDFVEYTALTPDSSGNWMLNSDKYKIGDTSYTASNFTTAYIAPFDTAIVLPNADFVNLENAIIAASSAFICAGDTSLTTCAAQNVCSFYYDVLPTLSFTIEKSTFSLPPQAYAFNEVDTNGDFYCLINIVGEDVGTLILGTPFFWGSYAAQFDYEKNTIGFAVVKNPTVPVKLHTPLPGWSIALIVIGSVAVVGGALFAILKCRKRD